MLRTSTGSPGRRPVSLNGGHHNQWTNAKLCDVGNLILGGILFASPWLFSFPAGVEIEKCVYQRHRNRRAFDRSAGRVRRLEEWLNLIVGLWLIVSPWVLKFNGTKAMRVELAIGIIVAVLAAIELCDVAGSAKASHKPLIRRIASRIGAVDLRRASSVQVGAGRLTVFSSAPAPVSLGRRNLTVRESTDKTRVQG